MSASKWEDKYLRIRDEHASLKKKCNLQETTIRNMFTRLKNIETMRKKEVYGGAAAAGAALNPTRTDKETDKLVKDLRTENQSLRRKNLHLSEKLRILQLSGASGKKAGGRTPKRSRPKTAGAKIAKTSSSSSSSVSASLDAASSLQGSERMKKLEDLIELLRGRLRAVEGKNKSLQAAKSQLQKQVAAHGSGKKRSSSPSRRSKHGGGGGGHGHLEDEVSALQRELKDKSAQVQLLTSRIEHMDARNQAGREIQERTVSKMEEDNRQIRLVCFRFSFVFFRWFTQI